MKKLLFTGLVTATTTLTTFASAINAQTVTDVSQEVYEQQYEGTSNDVLSLDYEEWNFFNTLVNQERNLLDLDDLPQVDVNLISRDGVNDLELYFINEGATHRDRLLFSTDAGETKELIFDDISSDQSIISESDGSLALGQGTSFGSFASDTNIDFFLGKQGGNVFFTSGAENNIDNINHLISYQVEFEGDDYYLLGFEDIWGGGDQDFNDTVFVVKGAVEPIPEPGAAMSLIALGGLGFMTLRKRESLQ